MSDIYTVYIIRSAFYVFFSETGGGGGNLVYGSLSSSFMAFIVFYSDE